jgi:hypothetical protein
MCAAEVLYDVLLRVWHGVQTVWLKAGSWQFGLCCGDFLAVLLQQQVYWWVAA